MKLASAQSAHEIDSTATADWGLDSFALVEAAGRACASALVAAAHEALSCRGPRIVALIGSGNNGADSLVLLRALILEGHTEAGNSLVILKDGKGGTSFQAKAPRTPRGEALKSVIALGVKTLVWDGQEGLAAIRAADIVLDGLSGTGIDGALRGSAAEMAITVAASRKVDEERRPLIFSIDVPSGLGDSWRPGMPVVPADMTLAIEPLKASLFLPDARPFAGKIVPVGGVFPKALLDSADGGELFDFAEASRAIPPMSPSVYKHERGVVEIRAGSPGATGAASLAAKGAQAAGAGLVRLVVDAAIRDVLAVSAGGALVATMEEAGASPRFAPDCVLAGPGWGRGSERESAFVSLAEAERSGLALVLDADALTFARGLRFSGNVILTPHPGEFSAYTGVAKDELLASPDEYLRKAAAVANAVIMLKGHVTRIASFDGRLAVVDGMAPVLAMGGSGDVLAGFAAAIAARSARASRLERRSFDPFAAAVAAAALLAAAGRIAADEVGFCDPGDIARIAGRIAATAWIKGEAYGK